MDKKVQEYEAVVQENTDTYMHRFGKLVIACDRNVFLIDKLQDELVFDIKMTIKELYDTNNDIIPIEKWTDHNVIASI